MIKIFKPTRRQQLFAFTVAGILGLGACSHSSNLTAVTTKAKVTTNTFDGKVVAIDLSEQRDTLNSNMTGHSFEYKDVKNMVKNSVASSLEGHAKKISATPKGDLGLRPALDLDVVNDYFSAGCLAKMNLTLLDNKGTETKKVYKTFKRSFFNGFGVGGAKAACNEAASEALTLALNAL